jgi:hypothetical protein
MNGHVSGSVTLFQQRNRLDGKLRFSAIHVNALKIRQGYRDYD